MWMAALSSCDMRRGAPGAFCLPPQSSWPPDCSKLPILAGPAGAHIHGQILAGAAGAALASYASVKGAMIRTCG